MPTIDVFTQVKTMIPGIIDYIEGTLVFQKVVIGILLPNSFLAYRAYAISSNQIGRNSVQHNILLEIEKKLRGLSLEFLDNIVIADIAKRYNNLESLFAQLLINLQEEQPDLFN